MSASIPSTRSAPAAAQRSGLPPSPRLSGRLRLGGVVYVGNGLLYAVRGIDGTLLWTFPADVTSDPVVTRGVIYVLGAKNGANGAVLPVLQRYAPPAARRYGTCQGRTAECWPPTGMSSAGWIPPPRRRIPLWAGGVVYAVSVSGELLALRASDGVKLWDYPANPRTVPVVAGGLVYVGNSAGELVALRASDGKPIWQFPAVFPLARSWSATRCLSATAPGSTRSAPDTAPAAHAAGCRARRACSRELRTH